MTSADVMTAVNNVPYIYGSTNTADALLTMSEQMFIAANGDRADNPNVCFLITDGLSNINSQITTPIAESAKEKVGTTLELNCLTQSLI